VTLVIVTVVIVTVVIVTVLIGTVIIVTVEIVTVVIVTVVIVTVVKVVIVTSLSKITWHIDNRCDVGRAAFCDSRDVYRYYTALWNRYMHNDLAA
jgi:hypothetical protein